MRAGAHSAQRPSSLPGKRLRDEGILKRDALVRLHQPQWTPLPA
jgi:hypothetical protein